MANLTNSAKLIQEMAKKANRTELPEVYNSTVNFTVNGNTGSQSMTTNQASNSTVNLTVNKTTVGLGNVDNTSDANKPISTATQAALDLKADKSDLSSVYKYKGSVASYSNLPSTGLTTGDVYNVEDTGMNYAWTGSAWDQLGASVDLSNYVDKSTNQTIGGTKTFSNEPVLPSKSTAAGNNATKPATEAQVYLKANDADVVKTSGNQTVAGTKTFSTSPVVPSKTSDATNTGTAIATEAQVYKKANTSDVLTKTNTTSYTPSANYHPTTKKYVDDRDTYIGSSAPTSNKVEGRLWYDTTNDQLKVYDGVNWNVTGKEYNSGPGIKIGSYSDMQGPAPDGFHVPSKNEWVALCGILNTAFSMEYNYTTMETYLKMPRAGYRDFSSSSVRGVGDYGYYWYSTPSGANAYYLFFSSSVFNIQNNTYRSKCHSIRCFKNSPTVPTSSWTTLYDGSSVASGAGVFWNSTEGLISVSGDGHTWYTIMDKNLGATTAYNQGDTLTDANCGNFYQWGNNYGFPHSGTVTVSTTLVDASNYGPGNYYSNSTFIIADIPYDRSSVRNDNLWGGVTGVTTLDNAITNTGVLSVNGQTGDVIISGGADYYWETKTITSGTVELGLRTIVNVNSNFTLNVPADLIDGEEYVLRCVSGEDVYTMTLGTGIINNFNVDLTLNSWCTDQFVFISHNGNLELQPEYQEKLINQTAYSNKGSATQVPKITTNTLGQVTNIATVDIDPYTVGDGIDKTNRKLSAKIGDGLFLGEYYAHMQGPCPEGFHIPTKNEFNLVVLLNNITSSYNVNTAFKFSGVIYRQSSNGTASSAGYDDFYRCCDDDSSTNLGNIFRANTIGKTSYIDKKSKCRGYKIRAFKDEYEEPDASWDVLYGDLTNGGIFWNQTKGLISCNITNRKFTMQDKDLGATSVGSKGLLFQRGNNYGFPKSGTISTSLTQINTSNYGPGEYKSSIFITTSDSESGDWSTTQNRNLWGGVDGVKNIDSITCVGIVSKNLSKVYKIDISSDIPDSSTPDNIITFVVS